MLKINKRLENYIFKVLEAEYCIDPIGVSSNIDNDEEKNKKYMGTYFPRSFVEGYRIYDNIFSNDLILNEFNKKYELNILDIGSGTGGNLMGLLNVLVKKLNNKHFKIHSFDGNKIALLYQKKLINDADKFLKLNGNKISLYTHRHKFYNKIDLIKTINELRFKDKFDIIQTFKFINEFYKNNYVKNKGMYSDIIKLSDRHLNESGILLILDITNKIGELTYNPIIMNNECKEYFQNSSSKLNYVLPISCAYRYTSCICNKCFSQKTFEVTHRYNLNDKSKVNYKLFMKDPLGKKILNSIKEAQCYLISKDNYCTSQGYKSKSEYFTDDDIMDPFVI